MQFAVGIHSHCRLVGVSAADPAAAMKLNEWFYHSSSIQCDSLVVDQHPIEQSQYTLATKQQRRITTIVAEKHRTGDVIVNQC
jgi:hypothetical protein